VYYVCWKVQCLLRLRDLLFEYFQEEVKRETEQIQSQVRLFTHLVFLSGNLYLLSCSSVVMRPKCFEFLSSGTCKSQGLGIYFSLLGVFQLPATVLTPLQSKCEEINIFQFVWAPQGCLRKTKTNNPLLLELLWIFLVKTFLGKQHALIS